ncbi:MAG: cupredoxin domain-containing protein [Alphaproteobacteria bacterium]|nr:cupredoxin domain-containing protein [Alphaproteobacteria bacterium]
MAIRIPLRKEDWIGAAAALVAFVALAIPLSHIMRKTLGAPHAVVDVTQRNRHYYPDKLMIPLGTVLHITNNDRFTHHVYVKSPLMNFDSGEEPVGTSVNLEFDHSGTFDVQCAIHPTMHLWVTVK